MSKEQLKCDHDCSHCESQQGGEECEKEQRYTAEMELIKHKIVVLSGKGGVGKSTVAVNLAYGLALNGARVGLLDVDIHGPSIPTMLGLKGSDIYTENDRIMPVEIEGVKVISIDFFMLDHNAAIIWRGPMKYSAIKQFLQDVKWGELDYLVVDCPPGTGDEPLGVCQMLKGDIEALVVTTPQEVAASDVRRSLDFCRQLKLPVLGVVENMSGFVCPRCGQVTYIFNQGGGEKLAKDAGVPFLGQIPIDPLVGVSCDAGTPFLCAAKSDTLLYAAFMPIVEAVQKLGK